MPLITLDLNKCNYVKDIKLISTFTNLEALCIPYHLSKDIEFLRKMPSLKKLIIGSYVQYAKPVKQFWKEYDAQKAKQKAKQP